MGQKLGKGLRIPQIDLEIKRKSTISDGNPDDSAETLRKLKLYGEVKYQPQIQFLEGKMIKLYDKIIRYITALETNA